MVAIRELKRARTIINQLAYDSEMVELDNDGVLQNALVYLTKIIQKRREQSMFEVE